MSPRWLHWPAATASLDWTDVKDGVFDVTTTGFGLWTMSQIEPCSTAVGAGGVDWFWGNLGGNEGCTGNSYPFVFYSISADSPEGTVDDVSIIVWNGSSWSAKFTGYCNTRRVYLSSANGDFGSLSNNSIYIVCDRIVTAAELAGFSNYA